jgi:PEP-CTERM motif
VIEVSEMTMRRFFSHTALCFAVLIVLSFAAANAFADGSITGGLPDNNQRVSERASFFGMAHMPHLTEPTVMVLLGTGLAGVAAMLRKRRKVSKQETQQG